MAQYSLLSIFVLLAVATSALAQYNSVQESSGGGGGGDGYFSGLMDNVSSLSEMDWQGMLRSVVETMMQYFVAPTTRAGAATSRALSNFEGDLVVNFVEKSPALSHIARTVHSYIVPVAHAPASAAPRQMIDPASASSRQMIDPASVSSRQMIDPASASPRQMIDPASASSRQISSTTPSPVLLDDHLRKILGPNPHLSDNKLLRSWEYAALMMAYCVACTLFGVLAVTLLPDPRTLEMIRGGGGEENRMVEAAPDMMMMGSQNIVDSVGYKKGYGAMEAAQNIVGVFGAMDDTDGYYQVFGEQNITGGQEATLPGAKDTKSNAAQDAKGYDRVRTQDAGVVAGDGSGNKKPSKRYNRYKDTTGRPPKNNYDYWAQFNNKQKSFLKSFPPGQSPENIPPSTHYQVIHGHGGRLEGSRQPLVSEESSYLSYSSQPS